MHRNPSCRLILLAILPALGLSARLSAAPAADDRYPDAILQNTKSAGYTGIWYYNQRQNDEYRWKYSGGLGTYCSSHNPFAVYCPAVDKTFFCYGAAANSGKGLLHAVSFYDHKTGTVPRPTILLDKQTDDAHDNPVISVDAQGHIWIFSSAHGTKRPAYISVSKKPYNIDQFEAVWRGNYSYPQVHYLRDQGFVFLQTRYGKDEQAPQSVRKLYCSTSRDGRRWTTPKLYAAIQQGHYQVSGSDGRRVGSAFNYHPSPGGVNYRSNLYYVETADFGRTFQNVRGERLKLPLTAVNNPALIHDYRSEGLNVYVMDLNFDADGRPVILYLTSKGWQSGPDNGPRAWHTARWTSDKWDIQGSIRSHNNYDMGSLWIEPGLWRIIGPTELGPQPYNTGGQIALWTSGDQGATWTKLRQMTAGSLYNHGYCRRPVNAHRDFYALWADGDGRKRSTSRLYYCDRDGNVFILPEEMKTDSAKPLRVVPKLQPVP
jgi:hypothetical protein